MAYKFAKAFFTGLLLLLTLRFSPAAARGCNWFTPCGEVDNQTGHQMTYTTRLNDAKADHWCQVWNYDDSGAKRVRCQHEKLNSPGHKGGGNVDVDAFTFADTNYVVIVGGQPIRQTRGVWTRISSFQDIECTRSISGRPWCTL